MAQDKRRKYTPTPRKTAEGSAQSSGRLYRSSTPTISSTAAMSKREQELAKSRPTGTAVPGADGLSWAGIGRNETFDVSETTWFRLKPLVRL